MLSRNILGGKTEGLISCQDLIYSVSEYLQKAVITKRWPSDKANHSCENAL